jgi:hypothetical protein
VGISIAIVKTAKIVSLTHFLKNLSYRRLIFSSSIVHLGCFITIMSLGITPFTQQGLKTEACSFTHLNLATIQITKSVSVDALTADGDLDLLTKGAILNSVAGARQATEIGLVDSCHSGNCSFPDGSNPTTTYTMLGFCAACFDTTGYVRQSSSWSEVSIPNNLTIKSQFLAMANMSIEVNRRDRKRFEDSTKSLAWLESSIDMQFIPALEASVANWTILTTTHAGCKLNKREDDVHYADSLKCDHPNVNITGDHWLGTNFLSTACALYPCAKEYTAKVREGHLNETLVSERPVFSLRPTPNSSQSNSTFYAIDTFCEMEKRLILDNVRETVFTSDRIVHRMEGGRIGLNLTGVREIIRISDENVEDMAAERIGVNIMGALIEIPRDCYVSLDDAYVGALTNFLSEILQGSCYALGKERSSFARNCSLSLSQPELKNDLWWLAALSNEGNATFESVSKTIHSVADAVTDRMRRWNGGDEPKRWVDGRMTVIKPTPCTHYAVEWLIMPAVMIMLGSVLLIVTMAGKTSDTGPLPVWKDSILPLVFAGAADDSVMYVNKIEELERAAGKRQAVLQQRAGEAGKWALVVKQN